MVKLPFAALLLKAPGDDEGTGNGSCDGCELPFIEASLAVYVCIPALDCVKTNPLAVLFQMKNKLVPVQSFLFASALI